MHLECLTPAARKVLKVLAPLVSKQGFVLAGGTAAALQLGHRMSVDFDFFCRHSFEHAKLVRGLGDLGLTATVFQQEPETLSVSVNGVKVSFYHYPYPFMAAATAWSGVSVAGLIDIASMKLVAMMQRGAKRDYVDLYFILQDMPFSKIAENMIRRYGVDSVNPIVIGKALVYFKDADLDPEPVYLGIRKEWTSVKKYFAGHMKQFVLDVEQARKEARNGAE